MEQQQESITLSQFHDLNHKVGTLDDDVSELKTSVTALVVGQGNTNDRLAALTDSLNTVGANVAKSRDTNWQTIAVWVGLFITIAGIAIAVLRNDIVETDGTLKRHMDGHPHNVRENVRHLEEKVQQEISRLDKKIADGLHSIDIKSEMRDEHDHESDYARDLRIKSRLERLEVWRDAATIQLAKLEQVHDPANN